MANFSSNGKVKHVEMKIRWLKRPNIKLNSTAYEQEEANPMDREQSQERIYKAEPNHWGYWQI